MRRKAANLIWPVVSLVSLGALIVFIVAYRAATKPAFVPTHYPNDKERLADLNGTSAISETTRIA